MTLRNTSCMAVMISAVLVKCWLWTYFFNKSCGTGWIIFDSFVLKVWPHSWLSRSFSYCWGSSITQNFLQPQNIIILGFLYADLLFIATPIVCVVITFIIILNTVIIPNRKRYDKYNDKYNDAISLMEAGQYTEALSAFEALEGLKIALIKLSSVILLSGVKRYGIK